MADEEKQYGEKHQLLVYRLLARRFRAASVLMLLAGLCLQIPRLFPDVFTNPIMNPDQLALLGLLLMLIGTTLFIAGIFRRRRAYVQCQPEYLLIHTAGGQVACAYQRINQLRPVRVGDIYRVKEIKGSQRPYIKPLQGESAIELVLSDYPLPEKELRRRLSQFVISTRDKGFTPFP